MSANGRLMDVMTRRQIFNERFAKSLSKESIAVLRKMARELGIIINEADLANGATKTLLAAINRAATQASDEMLLAIMPDLLAFADAESKFAQQALRGTTDAKINAPSKAKTESAVKAAKFKLTTGKTVEKATLKGLFAIFGNGVGREVGTIVAGGGTKAEILSQTASFINSRARAQADVTIRTTVNEFASIARTEVYKENPEIIQEERFVAVLDGNTTIQCSSLDGNVYKVGEGPQPSLHFGCRSIRIGVLQADVAMSVSGGSRVEPDGTKINARATYGGWLKDQPKAVQDEVLGVKRAELFRSDKLSIGKFTDDTGKVYTLDQLKEREPLAFS